MDKDFCYYCLNDEDPGCEVGLCQITADDAKSCISFDVADLRTHNQIAQENFYGAVMKPEGY